MDSLLTNITRILLFIEKMYLKSYVLFKNLRPSLGAGIVSSTISKSESFGNPSKCFTIINFFVFIFPMQLQTENHKYNLLIYYILVIKGLD